jgi:hypothetical protein
MQKGMAFYTPDVDLITGLPGPATRGTTSGAVCQDLSRYRVQTK